MRKHQISPLHLNHISSLSPLYLNLISSLHPLYLKKCVSIKYLNLISNRCEASNISTLPSTYLSFRHSTFDIQHSFSFLPPLPINQMISILPIFTRSTIILQGQYIIFSPPYLLHSSFIKHFQFLKSLFHILHMPKI